MIKSLTISSSNEKENLKVHNSFWKLVDQLAINIRVLMNKTNLNEIKNIPVQWNWFLSG